MTVAHQTTFRRFEEAHAAAQQQVAPLRHAMQWMTWGHPPRSAAAMCMVCGRTLRIERTRHGLFHLEGDALRACGQRDRALLLGTTSRSRPVAAPGGRDGGTGGNSVLMQWVTTHGTVVPASRYETASTSVTGGFGQRTLY